MTPAPPSPAVRVLLCQERSAAASARSRFYPQDATGRALWQLVAEGWHAAARYHYDAHYLAQFPADPVLDPPVYCDHPIGPLLPPEPVRLSEAE